MRYNFFIYNKNQLGIAVEVQAQITREVLDITYYLSWYLYALQFIFWLLISHYPGEKFITSAFFLFSFFNLNLAALHCHFPNASCYILIMFLFYMIVSFLHRQLLLKMRSNLSYQSCLKNVIVFMLFMYSVQEGLLQLTEQANCLPFFLLQLAQFEPT